MSYNKLTKQQLLEKCNQKHISTNKKLLKKRFNQIIIRK